MPENENKKPSAATAIKKYFGLKPDQKLADFVEEFKQLTAEDKEQLHRGIEDGSLNY